MTIVLISTGFRELYNLHSLYWNSLFHNLISSGDNAVFVHFDTATASHYNASFIVPAGTRHCWVARNSIG